MKPGHIAEPRGARHEFNHALDGPDTLKIFRSAHQHGADEAYRDALRPHLRKDVKIAAQAASSWLHHPPSSPPDDARTRHEAQWDALLKPEPWFDAVTVHLYPSASRVVSLEAARAVPATLDRIYPAMIARADEGFDRSIVDTVARVPGKEVWLTEWGGYDGATTFQLKMTSALVAAPDHEPCWRPAAMEVTVSTTLSFRRQDGRYALAGVLSWLFHAARS